MELRGPTLPLSAADILSAPTLPHRPATAQPSEETCHQLADPAFQQVAGSRKCAHNPNTTRTARHSNHSARWPTTADKLPDGSSQTPHGPHPTAIPSLHRLAAHNSVPRA